MTAEDQQRPYCSIIAGNDFSGTQQQQRNGNQSHFTGSVACGLGTLRFMDSCLLTQAVNFDAHSVAGHSQDQYYGQGALAQHENMTMKKRGQRRDEMLLGVGAAFVKLHEKDLKT